LRGEAVFEHPAVLGGAVVQAALVDAALVDLLDPEHVELLAQDLRDHRGTALGPRLLVAPRLAVGVDADDVEASDTNVVPRRATRTDRGGLHGHRPRDQRARQHAHDLPGELSVHQNLLHIKSPALLK